jgi:hypothetical protein
MLRHVVLANIRFHLRRSPIRQRAELHEFALLFHLRRELAGFGLLAPEPGGPGFQCGQLALERAHLAHFAAALARRNAGVEKVGAVERDHLLHFLAVRKDHFHLDTVPLPDGLHHLVGLVGQAAGIDREHAHAGGDARRQVHDRHAFLLKAGGDRKAVPVGLDGPRKDVARAGGLKAG